MQKDLSSGIFRARAGDSLLFRRQCNSFYCGSEPTMQNPYLWPDFSENIDFPAAPSLTNRDISGIALMGSTVLGLGLEMKHQNLFTLQNDQANKIGAAEENDCIVYDGRTGFMFMKNNVNVGWYVCLGSEKTRIEVLSLQAVSYEHRQKIYAILSGLLGLQLHLESMSFAETCRFCKE